MKINQIKNLQTYPSPPFGDWTTYTEDNPHGYFSWDTSIYPDGIRYNNLGSGHYYRYEYAALSQIVTFEYPQTRTIYIDDMATGSDAPHVEIWLDGTLMWWDYDSGTPAAVDIYFSAGTHEFKILYKMDTNCTSPSCNLNHVYRIAGYSPPPPAPGNLTINITPSDATYNVIDSLGNIVASNIPSGTTVTNLTSDTYSSTLTRNGYEDKLLTNIIIGPGDTIILTETLTQLPGNLTINITPSDATYNVIDSLGNIVASNIPSGTTVTNLTSGTYSSTLTRNGYEDKLLTNIIIGPGDTIILTETLTQLPATAGSGLLALISLGYLFGIVSMKKKCEYKYTKEDCEKSGCKWKDGKCIEKK